MSHARTTSARHGIEFERKIVVSNDIVNAIATFAKSDRSDVMVLELEDKVPRNLLSLVVYHMEYSTAVVYLFLW